MLVRLVVGLVCTQSGLVLSHGLGVVLLLFVKQANLYQCVSLSLQGECLRQD